MASAECGSCHAEVDWAVKWPEEFNDQGKPKTVPVDHGSLGDPQGRLEVWPVPVIPTSTGTPATVLRFRYLRQGERPAGGRQGGTSHFATCPEAGQWRRPRGGRST